MGRHSAEEVYQRGDEDLTALSTVLGEKPFFFGEAPSSLDAIAYAFVANVLHNVVQGPLAEKARKKQNLVAFCERMKARYFAEAEPVRRVA
jgi:glutathione S-transferase